MSVEMLPAGEALSHAPDGRTADQQAEGHQGGASRREATLRRDSLFRRSLAVADMCAVTLALTISAVVLGDDSVTAASLAVPVTFVAVVKAMGLYDRDEHLLHKTTLDEVPALFGIATLGALLLWLSNDLLIEGNLGQRQVLGTWILLFIFMVCLRALARGLAGRVLPVERCLLLGSAEIAAHLREKLALSSSVNAELVGSLPLDPRGARAGVTPRLPDELGSELARLQIERVVIATEADRRDDLLYTIRELKSFGVKVSVLPEASRVAGSSVEVDRVHGITLLGVRRFEFTRSSRLIKRSFDVVGSCLLLLTLSPLLLALALAIRLDSPGPVVFRQLRVGRHGRKFEMLKFRSMVNEAEQRKAELQGLNQGAKGLFKIDGDPRATGVGRRIRPWQLDELPQLWNVLRGEMSLVGPRPLIPREDDQIEGWYRRRLDVPPGMTGHWQILGSSTRIPLAEMVKLDYLYVANWSLWGDITLLLRTIPFVLGRRGV